MRISRTDHLPISLLLVCLSFSTIRASVAEGSSDKVSNKDLQIVSPTAPANKGGTKVSSKTGKTPTMVKAKSQTSELLPSDAPKKTDGNNHAASQNQSSKPKSAERKDDLTTSSAASAKDDSAPKKDGTPAAKPAADTKAELKQSKPEKGLVDAENGFGLSSYRHLGDASPAKNIFISPYSLHSCLHLVFNGAGGNTLTDMAKALGLSPSNKAKENDEYTKLSEQVSSSSGSESAPFVFSTANSIWANKTIKLKPEFVETAKKTFSAEVRNVDFSEADSVNSINNWVNDKTHKKIPKILDKLDAQDALVALNAAYFKARWKSEFNKQWTKEADFRAPSAVKKVSMMDARGTFNYFENDQLQVVELPYLGGKASMVVLLPREKSSLADLRHALLVSNYDSWLNGMESQPGEIFLPKFKLEYNVSCRDFLKAAGMNAPFGDSADFSEMITPPPSAKISQVVHKTFVKVDEDGTEAAAATAVVERALSLMVQKQQEPFKMIVDRPFIYAIIDWKSHAILFVGQVVDPTQG